MLVVMQSNATKSQIQDVCDRIDSLGLKAHAIPGAGRTAIGITGNNGAVVPGHPLAYDFETGFGLVQPLGKLGLAALPCVS